MEVKIVMLLLLAFISACICCTSSRHKMPSITNVVHNFPSLYSFDRNRTSNIKRHLHCPRDESFEDCNLIHVDLSALKSAKIRVPLDQKDQDAYMVLKKVSQQGIEVLDQEKSRASATITFKAGKAFDTFVVKQKRLFGSFSSGDGKTRFHITVCESHHGVKLQDDQLCQLLIAKKEKVAEKS